MMTYITKYLTVVNFDEWTKKIVIHVHVFKIFKLFLIV